MLSLLSDFHEQDSQVTGLRKPAKRRKRIFDTMQDTEAKATRVDVVFKSDDAKSCILTILRYHHYTVITTTTAINLTTIITTATTTIAIITTITTYSTLLSSLPIIILIVTNAKFK